jgi:hypothetical protein
MKAMNMNSVDPTPLRVVVIDDQEIARAGFAALLDSQPDFAVTATAADGAEAIRPAGPRAGRRRRLRIGLVIPQPPMATRRDHEISRPPSVSRLADGCAANLCSAGHKFAVRSAERGFGAGDRRR